jgi:carboxypeptidase Taq
MALVEVVQRINDVLNAVNLLNWDSGVMIPSGRGAASSRSTQVATLKGLAHELLLSPRTAVALEEEEAGEHIRSTALLLPRCWLTGVITTAAPYAAVEAAKLAHDDARRRAAQAVRAAVDFHSRVPPSLLAERDAITGAAGPVWVQARASDDFGLFLPHLERIVDVSRRYARAAQTTQHAHPYDALLELYEPGETIASLRALFSELRSGLAPLLRSAAERLPITRHDFLRREGAFPVEVQRRVAAELARAIGFDFRRGRLDEAVHPFEVSQHADDVRITTRYNQSFISAAIFGTLHESGHGMYEQGIDPALSRTALATDLPGMYAVGGASFGTHESQSRLFENHVGRSREFWCGGGSTSEGHYLRLQRAFPEGLGDVSADEFWRAINLSAPSCIRVEADELTYDFHIMMRVEMEAELIDGSLQPGEVPARWAAAMRDSLGLTPPSNSLGCLQDVHWSSCHIGSFASYTIGNVMAAQLMEAAHEQLGAELQSSLRQGDTSVLRGWLRENIWKHGRQFSRDELLIKATGSPLHAQPYLRYLMSKYGGDPVAPSCKL